ncbi:MAG TPA: FGGY-family carbohydrate kinase [Plantibacter sp.]|uniref:rhamnulokinase n=1 Tax=unclassified Plantibacter TaxID=2624265 RepID=UPI002C389479|nr:FGGY-family carbohydrate kinase [Plantibacter sp.]
MSEGPLDRFHAAVDLGASSGRVVLGRWNASGLELLEVRRFPNGPIESDGRLIWDAERLFDETLLGLAEAVRVAQDAGAQLDGIGIDSWGVDVGLVDDGAIGVGSADVGRTASGPAAPAAPAVPTVHHHRGADALGPAVAAGLVDAATAYGITGVLEQSINTSYQLRSRAVEAAEGAADVTRRTVLLVPDLWVQLLTGITGAERTIASTTQLLDQRTGEWSVELIDRWGLSGFDFPTIVAPGTLAGPTTPAVTERLGAAAPIPVYRVAGHDTASALAFARPANAELLVSSGSWSLAGVCLEEPVLTESARIAGFTNEAGADGSSLLIRNLAGMWLLTECARGWSEEDGRRIDPVELVEEATEQSERSERDVTAVPSPVFDVGDPSLLVPGDMPARIAALCRAAGQDAPVGRIGVVRSIIESLAVAYAETVHACETITGTPLRSVRIVGGGSRNRLLCRRTAERTGLPVAAGPAEASALGNLAVQLVAAGAAPSVAEVYRVGGSAITGSTGVDAPAVDARHHDRESA